MFNYREERMKQCLRCPVCHEVLQNYGNILAIGNGKKQDDEIVNELAALLKIKGTNKQKFDVLFSLSKQYKNPEGYFKENTDCLCSLNRLIFSIKHFVGEETDYESLLSETPPMGFRTLREMLVLLAEKYRVKQSKSFCSDSPTYNSKMPKNYSDAFEFFKTFKCKYLRPYIEGKKELDRYSEDDEQPEVDWETYADFTQKVFDDFCFGSPESGVLPPYEYCAPQYGHPELGNCQSAMFLALANQLKKQVGSMELDKIPSAYQNIALQYVEQAPKHFGRTLAKVMERQGMIDQDIVYLLDLPRATHLQAWYKSEQPKSLDNYLEKLARCLLVTKEVLICGTGERYGSWEEVLSKEGIGTIKKGIESNSQDSARVWTRSKIKEWLAMSNEEFEELMADNPGFFAKEPFCVYEIEEDGETFPDYPSMVKNLLHPEEFEVLIQVLQNQQDQ